MYPINKSCFTAIYPPVDHKKIVHTWIGDTYVVHLLRKEDKLLYQVLDITNKVDYSNQLEIPPSKSIEQMIKIMKLCRVCMGDNAVPNFLHNHRTWNLKNKQIHLLRDSENLVWNIFHRGTRTNLFPPIQTATIPSSRCHPETIALIEKIKEDSLNTIYIRYLREDFEVTRVLSSEEVNKEAIQLGYDQLDILEARDNQRDTSEYREFAAQVGGGGGALYLAWNTIISTAGAVGSWLGGGTLATVAAGSVGVGLGALSLGVGVALPALIITPYIESLYAKETQKVKDIRERVSRLTIERPIFVEIEPKSLPSEIDDRMRVSKFTWAVTLVTYKGACGNHAQIIAEGINDGFYNSYSSESNNGYSPAIGQKFTYLAHINPPIESKLVQNNALKFGSRSEIWMRSAHQTKKMIQNIEEETKTASSYNFNCWGIRSKIYKFDLQNFNLSAEKGDNCFTWAQKKLRIIDVNLEEKVTDYAAALVRNHTRKPEQYLEIPVQQLI